MGANENRGNHGYTPTTEQVRTDYVMSYADRDSSQLLAGAAFDRWLNKIRSEAKAEGAAEYAAGWYEDGGHYIDLRNWLEARAARIREGGKP